MVTATSPAISGQQGIQVNIPSGSPVMLTGYTQGDASQSVEVKDSNGQTVATIKGAGHLKAMTTETFTSDGNAYMVYFFHDNHSHDSEVISNHMDISDGTTTFGGTWTFLTEDELNSNRDYNDSAVQLTWTRDAG